MILKTKLITPPLRKRPVERPHLVQRLNQGLLQPQHRLTAVNAPAGYGKTTLLALWLARIDWPHAWLSLASGENDPPQFFTYLFAALQRLHPDWGLSAQALLHSLPPPGHQELISAGKSNAAIAGELVLAVSTVKWHLHNLYGKLGVRSRTQAVARARALGLLASE